MLRDEAKLREYYADAPADISLADVDLDRIPRHVSIIMDGNGRWAQAAGSTARAATSRAWTRCARP